MYTDCDVRKRSKLLVILVLQIVIPHSGISDMPSTKIICHHLAILFTLDLGFPTDLEESFNSGALNSTTKTTVTSVSDIMTMYRTPLPSLLEPHLPIYNVPFNRDFPGKELPTYQLES